MRMRAVMRASRGLPLTALADLAQRWRWEEKVPVAGRGGKADDVEVGGSPGSVGSGEALRHLNIWRKTMAHHITLNAPPPPTKSR